MSLTAFNRQRRLKQVEEMKPENIASVKEEIKEEVKIEEPQEEVKNETVAEEVVEETPTRRRRRTN